MLDIAAIIGTTRNRHTGDNQKDHTMTEYTQTDPAARFDDLDRMATNYFSTTRWKTEFARQYGLTPTAINAWRTKGAPLWSCVAMAHALEARELASLARALEIAGITSKID